MYQEILDGRCLRQCELASRNGRRRENTKHQTSWICHNIHWKYQISAVNDTVKVGFFIQVVETDLMHVGLYACACVLSD